MKFRKKPVVIEAVHYDGTEEGYLRVCEFTSDAPVLHHSDHTLTIPTLEGNMIAQPGDWIIRGVRGELYPCKPDIFKATYEQVVVSGVNPDGSENFMTITWATI